MIFLYLIIINIIIERERVIIVDCIFFPEIQWLETNVSH